NSAGPGLDDAIAGVGRHSFSGRAIGRRLRATRVPTARWLNFVRAVAAEGFGRIRHDTIVRRLLDHDRDVRRFFEGESEVLPAFYTDKVRKDLGPWWDARPEGGLRHDPNAYLKAHEAPARTVRVAVPPRPRPPAVPSVNP